MILRLHANDLASKWGFSDGDMPDELHDLPGIRDVDWHDVLKLIVKRHLLPLVPGVTVSELMTHHNPIRADTAWLEFCADSDVFVDVTPEQITAALKDAKE